MVTARRIVKKALQKNGVLTMGEEPSAEMANDGLDALNAMLSSWSNDSMLIYARVRETFPLSANVGTYTIGPAKTFDTIRPMFIVDAFVRQNTVDYDMSVVPDEVYDGIIVKTQNGIPDLLNYSNEYPTANIRLWPVPSTAYILSITSEKELSQFTLDDEVDLPPGWELALIYNLAILIAPEYGQPVDPVVVEVAQKSKGAIQTAIMRNRTMDAQAAGQGRRNNIYSGGYN
jgi:hypothetical protein